MSLRFLAACTLALPGISLVAMAPQPLEAQARSDLSFPVDQERRQRNFDAAARDLAQTDRNLAGIVNDIRAALRAQDLLTPEMRRLGLDSSDLGDVLALAQFSAVMLADGGRTDDPTPAQLDGLRSAIQSAGGAQLAALTAGEKQDLADRMLFIVVVQQTLAEALAGQPALDPWLQQFAMMNSQMLGFDVTRVRMGASGFAGGGQSSAPVASSPSPAAAPSANSPLARNGTAEILGARYDYYFDGITSINRINLLFKDGSACHDCLEDFIAGRLSTYASRNPEDMGRWSRQGSDFIVRYADGRSQTIANGELRKGARTGLTFNAELESTSGITLPTLQSLRVDTLTLRSDGRFSWGSDGGIMTGNAVAGRTAPNLSGRYLIDGYAIRFDFDDGRSETKSFLLYDADDLFLLIDGDAFYVEE